MAIESPLYLPNGKMMLNGDNMVEVPSDCCCPDPCGGCDPTPASLRVTFSSLAVCTNCIRIFSEEHFNASNKYIVTPTVPTGPYILTQHATEACQYNFTTPWTGALTHYTTIDCTGAPFGTYDIQSLNIRADLFSAHAPSKDIRLWAWWTTTEVHGGGDVSSEIFDGVSGDGSGDCTSFSVLTNDRTDCTATTSTTIIMWTFVHLGIKDGVATVVPV